LAMATRLYLFAALLTASLISADTAIASNDPSGLWNISYEVQWGDSGDLPAESSMASIYEEGSTLRGESSLGNRSDGSLIGLSNGNDFDAAITFRQKPSVFMRLKGGCIDKNLQGSFTASSSNGHFWRGRFTASQARPGEMWVQEDEINPLEYMTKDVTVAPAPTLFIEPEAFFYEQTGKAERRAFAINYSRNTILMCRNVPMLWQWWL
jgi:hypothetical protein